MYMNILWSERIWQKIYVYRNFCINFVYLLPVSQKKSTFKKIKWTKLHRQSNNYYDKNAKFKNKTFEYK